MRELIAVWRSCFYFAYKIIYHFGLSECNRFNAMIRMVSVWKYC